MAKSLWVRAGITLHLTDDEAKRLLEIARSGNNEREALVEKVLADGRYTVDGECYSPGSAIADYNREYGTQYPEEDLELFW